jgi:hypothetical protein
VKKTFSIQVVAAVIIPVILIEYVPTYALLLVCHVTILELDEKVIKFVDRPTVDGVTVIE